MELYYLQEQDHEELIDLLNVVFTRKNGRPMDFCAELPKMAKPELARCHIGIREDGRLRAVLGVYPIPTNVCGTPMLFSTVGNVATHWDYEGRGYMGMLMKEAMAELARIGADVSRLGGQRQRYNRYGYENSAISYEFTVSGHNILRTFPEFHSDLCFTKIEKQDTQAIAAADAFYRKKRIHVERDDPYAYMTAWRNIPYLATRPDGTPVGYLSCGADGGGISEFGAMDTDTELELLCAWQKKVERNISFSTAPDQTALNRRVGSMSDATRLSSPCHFKIINWEKLLGALLREKNTYAALPNGTLTVEIADYGPLALTVEGANTNCERTDAKADLTLDRLTATRFFFGLLPPESIAPSLPLATAWFPLPLSWCGNDRL